MAANKHHNIHKHEPIRNVPAFLKAFFSSESGKRALTRNPSFTEHKLRDNKGEWSYRDNFKGNQIAVALHNAIQPQTD